jgi:general secretion pathway protein E
MTAASPQKTPARSLVVPPRGRLDMRHLLKWLRDDGHLTHEDADRLVRRFAQAGSSLHPLIRLGGLGLKSAKDGSTTLTTEALTAWLGARFHLPVMRIDPLKVEASRVQEVMSQAYAESRHALPVGISSSEVTIVTCEPFAVDWLAEIEAHTKRKVRLLLAAPDEVTKYTAEFYQLAQSVRVARKSNADAGLANTFEQLVDLKSRDNLDANDQGVVQIVDWLWQYAFEQRASDIHLEPRRDTGAIRFRIDGVLHTVHRVPAPVMAAMTARIKLLGRMDVIERRRPQDGRIKTRRPDNAPGGGGEVEMRLSTLPTAFGEKVVMRIFDPGTADKPFESLGFSADEAQRWGDLIGRPHGIILVTGPTGSGKTTTLYSTLKKLATDEVNVCTVEDPIEMIEPAFNQTQVQPSVDLNFAEGLRALMRQDPDIIMVGEIRDLETAEMAIQAALTGHLVFSTLHTNDAPSAITRMVDLGVPPYLIAATVIGVLAQRLTRTLCPDCKQPDPALSLEKLDELAKPWKAQRPAHVYRPVGCTACRSTGYRGRAALYELMTVSESLRETMYPQLDVARLRQRAGEEGLRPLRVAGLAKVAEGVTSVEEVLRCTPRWEIA